ncbi:hypothetical protein SCLCIDRAFT_33175 [Scleroderma citrinum Foug A]|uniref:Uncharacterized protein n=1 Tax=Scleroderma citrinum Foug A TaxID=1036808 RepID=A0A0C2YPY0_9AGAM|nr:hypothetical protein SCLCIDRAFT_33175 [Scleroderma citrinum Foug A]
MHKLSIELPLSHPGTYRLMFTPEGPGPTLEIRTFAPSQPNIDQVNTQSRHNIGVPTPVKTAARPLTPVPTLSKDADDSLTEPESEEDPIVAALQHGNTSANIGAQCSVFFSNGARSPCTYLLLEKAKKLACSPQLGETSKWLASPSEYDCVQPKHLKEDSDTTIIFKGSWAK